MNKWVCTLVFFLEWCCPLSPLLEALPGEPVSVLSSFFVPNLFSNQVLSVSVTSFALKSGSNVCWSFVDLGAAEPDMALSVFVGFVGPRFLVVLKRDEQYR